MIVWILILLENVSKNVTTECKDIRDGSIIVQYLKLDTCVWNEKGIL